MSPQHAFFNHLRECKQCHAARETAASTASTFRFCQTGFVALLAGLFASNRDKELKDRLEEALGHATRAVAHAEVKL